MKIFIKTVALKFVFAGFDQGYFCLIFLMSGMSEKHSDVLKAGLGLLKGVVITVPSNLHGVYNF